MTKRRSSLSPLILDLVMFIKHNHRMCSLSNVVEAKKCRHNDSKSLRKKKSVRRAKSENKLKEIAEWNAFCAALVDIEESTTVKEWIESHVLFCGGEFS